MAVELVRACVCVGTQNGSLADVLELNLHNYIGTMRICNLAT